MNIETINLDKMESLLDKSELNTIDDECITSKDHIGIDMIDICNMMKLEGKVSGICSNDISLDEAKLIIEDLTQEINKSQGLLVRWVINLNTDIFDDIKNIMDKLHNTLPKNTDFLFDVNSDINMQQDKVKIKILLFGVSD